MLLIILIEIKLLQLITNKQLQIIGYNRLPIIIDNQWGEKSCEKTGYVTQLVLNSSRHMKALTN